MKEESEILTPDDQTEFDELKLDLEKRMEGDEYQKSAWLAVFVAILGESCESSLDCYSFGSAIRSIYYRNLRVQEENDT